MRYKLCIIVALLVLPLTIQAQRKKGTVKPKVEEPAEDPRITQMLSSVQQIMFVDSVVVDRNDFMKHIPLSPHIGKLSQTAGLGMFTSEMGDHRLCTTADTIIAETDFIANRWTEARPVNGIGNAPAINPFLMPDGITLYYAQKGEKSIGGFDIFVTRYDSERRTFLKPENIGMPFSSEADDLFYAIDEFNQLGYFVTNRRQPADKVCIYTFIPQDSRRIYRSETYEEKQLRALAAINRIADTWEKGEKRHEALARLEGAKAAIGNLHDKNITPKNQTELDALHHEADVLDKTLALTRKHYATASENERAVLRTKILDAERQLEQLQQDIKNKEKQIPDNN